MFIKKGFPFFEPCFARLASKFEKSTNMTLKNFRIGTWKLELRVIRFKAVLLHIAGLFSSSCLMFKAEVRI
jgi:hypothetical protein